MTNTKRVLKSARPLRILRRVQVSQALAVSATDHICTRTFNRAKALEPIHIDVIHAHYARQDGLLSLDECCDISCILREPCKLAPMITITRFELSNRVIVTGWPPFVDRPRENHDIPLSTTVFDLSGPIVLAGDFSRPRPFLEELWHTLYGYDGAALQL